MPGMCLASALLLAASLVTPGTAAQSLDAARVTQEPLSSPPAASARSVEIPTPSFLVDLGSFGGWLDVLTAALRERPSTVGLHRPVPTSDAGDLAPRLAWTGDGPVSATFQVCSRGAQSVRARVAASLPAAADVTVFDSEGGTPRGGWTGATIAEDGANGAWLPAQEGECLIVEVMLPSPSDASSVKIWLRTVAHRFTEAQLAEALAIVSATAPQSRAGSPAVAPRHRGIHSPQCPRRYVSACDRLDAEVTAHATAVAHYHYESAGGSYLCTGTLVNDGKDGRTPPGPLHPLFLTAAHCVATPAEARSMDVVFDWVADSCSPEPAKTISGPSQLHATAGEFDQTLVQLPRWPAAHSVAGRYAMGWNASPVREGVETRTLSHPGGALLAYTASVTTGVRPPVPVGGYRVVYNSIGTFERDGMTEPGSSGSALVKKGPEGYVIGVLSYGPTALASVCAGLVPPTSGYGGFRDFYPHIVEFISGGPSKPPRNSYHVPLVLRATGQSHGFVRISSLAAAQGQIRIVAIDDEGVSRGPVTLSIRPAATVFFTSFDMERGNAARGLPGWGAPSRGRGHWRLEVESDIPLDVHAYSRTPDGFLTSLAQPTETIGDEADGKLHAVPFINPASNQDKRSFLRLTNMGTVATTVTFELWDNNGGGPFNARFFVMPGKTRQISAVDIERQTGDGYRKWKGFASAAPPVPLTVMSILDTVSGHVANVSR